ncbi:MAG: hypothetical protein V1712_02215 [Patescibacteria group bacterium]
MKMKVDSLCGGEVELFVPPNSKYPPYMRCKGCGRPVPSYEIKTVRRKKTKQTSSRLRHES